MHDHENSSSDGGSVLVRNSPLSQQLPSHFFHLTANTKNHLSSLPRSYTPVYHRPFLLFLSEIQTPPFHFLSQAM